MLDILLFGDKLFMEKSLNKLFENSFRAHWDYLALSNYKGENLQYKDVAKESYILEVREHLNERFGEKYPKNFRPEHLCYHINEQPNYAKIAWIQIFPEEFEKTPKRVSNVIFIRIIDFLKYNP